MRDHLAPGYGVRIPTGEVQWRFSTSGGPGGQHANKASTAVEAILDVAGSPALGDDVRARLRARLGDEVRVAVDRTRSQARNRELALDALEERLRDALTPRRRRRPTKPSAGARRRRLDAKRRRSETKSLRRRPRRGDW